MIRWNPVIAVSSFPEILLAGSLTEAYIDCWLWWIHVHMMQPHSSLPEIDIPLVRFIIQDLGVLCMWFSLDCNSLTLCWLVLSHSQVYSEFWSEEGLHYWYLVVFCLRGLAVQCSCSTVSTVTKAEWSDVEGTQTLILGFFSHFISALFQCVNFTLGPILKTYYTYWSVRFSELQFLKIEGWEEIRHCAGLPGCVIS